jgi:hypothetical protein
MKLLLHILCLAATVAPAAAAAPVDAPLRLDDPAWWVILSGLVPSGDRQAPFTERRYFPFRREPVVLTGELRLSPTRGLSLEYLRPQRRLVIIDDRGLLLRSEDGDSRTVPSDERFQAAIRALVDLLCFNPANLQEAFVITGHHAGGTWSLNLVPRNPARTGGLSTLVMAGTGGRVDRIEMRWSASRRILISMGEATEVPAFPPAVTARCFR